MTSLLVDPKPESSDCRGGGSVVGHNYLRPVDSKPIVVTSTGVVTSMMHTTNHSPIAFPQNYILHHAGPGGHSSSPSAGHSTATPAGHRQQPLQPSGHYHELTIATTTTQTPDTVAAIINTQSVASTIDPAAVALTVAARTTNSSDSDGGGGSSGVVDESRRQRNAERMRMKRQNPEFRERQKQMNRERQRRLRQSIEYRNREKQRQKERKEMKKLQRQLATSGSVLASCDLSAITNEVAKYPLLVKLIMEKYNTRQNKSQKAGGQTTTTGSN